MSKLIEQYELVKELHYHFDNIESKIIGRIYKIIDGPNANYMWSINYYCRLNDEASYYYPSAPFGITLENAENNLFDYVKRFEEAIDWEENDLF